MIIRPIKKLVNTYKHGIESGLNELMSCEIDTELPQKEIKELKSALKAAYRQVDHIEWMIETDRLLPNLKTNYII